MALVRTLSTFTFPEGIDWENEYESQGVRQRNRTTLGGNTVVFTDARLSGKPIRLVADPILCWFTPTERDDLINLAEVPGSVYTFTWGDDAALPLFTTSVVFDHSRGPAVDFRPIQRLDTRYFVGRFLLLTV